MAPKVINFLIVTLLITGCSQLQTRQQIQSKRQNQKQNVNKSEVDVENSSSTTGATGISTAPKEHKVALILGPGGYKAFAHAGVIKELRKNNIPIHKVVGLEFGALVGGLFAQRGQINEAEWKLYKLEKTDLDGAGFFSNKTEMRSLKILDEYLKENLDARDVSNATVPFFCPSLHLNQGTVLWQDSGSMVSAVRNCLAYPPLFNSPQPIVAGLFSLDEIARRLKSEGFDILILVNVLGDGNLFDNPTANGEYAPAVIWNEVRRSIWQARGGMTDVIDVTTRGISMTDFSSRKILVTAGEAAGERAAKLIADKYGF